MPSLEIVVTRGPSKGARAPLDSDRPVTLGRGADCTLALADGKVSSRHARIDLERVGVTITDLGSKNGTFVDGMSVLEPVRIRPGQEISLGNSSVELIAVEEPGGAPIAQPAVAPEQIRARIDTVRELAQPVTRERVAGATKAQRSLAILHEIGALVSSEIDEDGFLRRLMDLIFTLLPADRGALILVDADGTPQTRARRATHERDEATIHVSRTILGKVLDEGISILTADAGSDARLADGASIVIGNVRSAMCVPIRGKRRTLGAIYVDTVLSVGVFGKDDLHVLTTVGIVAGTALENIELFRRNLEQARMAAIGQVVAGLGHDIRNMLTALRGGVFVIDELVRERDDEELRGAWDIVRYGQDSIGNLVQDMVNFSKRREPDWRMCDINAVVHNAVSFQRQRAEERGIALGEFLDPTIPQFLCEPSAIERCVLNLVSNALDACTEKSGSVRITTQPNDDGTAALITVQDDGEGIPPERHQRIFDLLYSTKGSRGTGFGLAITKKIVEEHGGRIHLRSEPGAGASFTLELPCRTQVPAEATAAIC